MVGIARVVSSCPNTGTLQLLVLVAEDVNRSDPFTCLLYKKFCGVLHRFCNTC